jgi:hypothetical protein
MSYKLKSGQTPADAAFEILGDARLVNELHVVNGTAYLRGEHQGPPAKYAAAWEWPKPKNQPPEAAK